MIRCFRLSIPPPRLLHLLLLILLLHPRACVFPLASRFSRFGRGAPPRPPSLVVHDDFFDEHELRTLRRLCAWLGTLQDNLFLRPAELLARSAKPLSEVAPHRPPVGTEPAFRWIYDIVQAHAPAELKYVEIWAQPSADNVNWHVDKDEELYHRNRVLRAPDMSFVAYVKERGGPVGSYSSDETRGLLICSEEDCNQIDRLSPLSGRLVVFDPKRPHMAEDPGLVFDVPSVNDGATGDTHHPEQQPPPAASGDAEDEVSNVGVFHNGPGPLHFHEHQTPRGFRCLVFNAWSTFTPEHLTNTSSHGLMRRSSVGGWTTSGPFSDGPASLEAAELGRRLRQRPQHRLRRLRPGRFAPSRFANEVDNATLSLHIASRAGAADAVREMLERNAFVDDTVFGSGTDSLLTPLHAAAASGSADTVRVLLRHGAAVHGLQGAMTRDGRSPLHVAVVALARRVKRGDEVVKAGSVASSEETVGTTPGTTASSPSPSSYEEVVNLLAEHGSPADDLTRKIMHSIQESGGLSSGSDEEPGKISHVNNNKGAVSLFHMAIRQLDVEEVRRQLEILGGVRGHDEDESIASVADMLFSVDAAGHSPLHTAILSGDPAILEILLESARGQAHDVQSRIIDSRLAPNGWTPLMYAACRSQSYMVMQLLKAGAEPWRRVVSKSLLKPFHNGHKTPQRTRKASQTFFHDETAILPLHCAAMRGDTWSATELLKWHRFPDRQVDVTDAYGRTPLHLAAEQLQPTRRINRQPSLGYYRYIVRLLLKRNATVDLDGYTAGVPRHGTTRYLLVRAGAGIASKRVL